MTFASLRLIRKRPFIVLTFDWRGLQAIGSEVAAETSRSAERNAPAKIVAVSRAETKVANIFKTPCDCLGGLDHRACVVINARGVPNRKSRYFSVAPGRIAQGSPVNRTVC